MIDLNYPNISFFYYTTKAYPTCGFARTYIYKHIQLVFSFFIKN